MAFVVICSKAERAARIWFVFQMFKREDGRWGFGCMEFYVLFLQNPQDITRDYLWLTKISVSTQLYRLGNVAELL